MEFETLFIETKGQPIIYKGKEIRMIDKIDLPGNEINIKLVFLSTDSQWKQGIVLKTNGKFTVNDEVITNKIVLWEHTAPKEVSIFIKSKDKSLIIYNVWLSDKDSVEAWHNGSAIYVESLGNTRIYNCNDGYPDDDFNDLIFKVEFLEN